MNIGALFFSQLPKLLYFIIRFRIRNLRRVVLNLNVLKSEQYSLKGIKRLNQYFQSDGEHHFDLGAFRFSTNINFLYLN
jgi:hypothetical protein